jgi:predicted GTPase
VALSLSPIDLKRIISVNKPIANIRYELEEVAPGVIEEMVAKVVAKG